MEEGIANFHLHFMVRLCKFMGIMPVNDYSGPESIFSLPAAKFADTLKNEKPLSPFSLPAGIRTALLPPYGNSGLHDRQNRV